MSLIRFACHLSIAYGDVFRILERGHPALLKFICRHMCVRLMRLLNMNLSFFELVYA